MYFPSTALCGKNLKAAQGQREKSLAKFMANLSKINSEKREVFYTFVN